MAFNGPRTDYLKIVDALKMTDHTGSVYIAYVIRTGVRTFLSLELSLIIRRTQSPGGVIPSLSRSEVALSSCIQLLLFHPFLQSKVLVIMLLNNQRPRRIRP